MRPTKVPLRWRGRRCTVCTSNIPTGCPDQIWYTVCVESMAVGTAMVALHMAFAFECRYPGHRSHPSRSWSADGSVMCIVHHFWELVPIGTAIRASVPPTTQFWWVGFLPRVVFFRTVPRLIRPVRRTLGIVDSPEEGGVGKMALPTSTLDMQTAGTPLALDVVVDQT